jgi:hypothetical protein
LVPGQPFQPEIMFASKAGAYPSEALRLTHKHLTRLERLAKDKHSSLLTAFINFEGKMFYKICPGWF